jgi:hypothetical protein
MEATLTERDLVIAFRDAKFKKDKAREALEAAQSEFDKYERELIEMLEANNATSTAKYEGIGHVSLVKPQLYASCKKEYEEKLFAFLNTQGREDFIKQSVNSRSLSGFVKEMLDGGITVPEFISYYLKPSARLIAAA